MTAEEPPSWTHNSLGAAKYRELISTQWRTRWRVSSGGRLESSPKFRAGGRGGAEVSRLALCSHGDQIHESVRRTTKAESLPETLAGPPACVDAMCAGLWIYGARYP